MVRGVEFMEEAIKTSNGTELKKRHNLSYNALRGMAALGIFFSHMSYLKEAQMPLWSNLYEYFMRHGSVYSSFFYTLSGFLAVYTWKNVNFRDYIAKKLKKIYPLVFCVLILAVMLDVMLKGNGIINGEGIAPGSGYWWFNIIMGITMLKAFVPLKSTFYSFHGPSWYMSALIVFYILAWFIVPRLTDGANRKRQEIIRTKIAVVCAFAYVVQAILCFIVDWKDLEDIRLWVTYVNPYFRIFGECFLGMTVACCMDRFKLAKNGGGFAQMAVLSFAFLMLLVRSFVSGSIWNAWIYSLPNVLLLLVFYTDEGKIADILHAKPFQFLGSVSFELYMTHAFVYEGLPIAFGILNSKWQEWLISHAGMRFLITMVLAIVFARMVKIVFTVAGKLKKSK